jgi:hypothetical protein
MVRSICPKFEDENLSEKFSAKMGLIKSIPVGAANVVEKGVDQVLVRDVPVSVVNDVRNWIKNL